MLIKSQPTSFLQICCEVMLYSNVIFKSISDPDNTFWGYLDLSWDHYGNKFLTFSVYYPVSG